MTQMYVTKPLLLSTNLLIRIWLGKSRRNFLRGKKLPSIFNHNLHVKVYPKYLHDINYASTTPCYVANYILFENTYIKIVLVDGAKQRGVINLILKNYEKSKILRGLTLPDIPILTPNEAYF